MGDNPICSSKPSFGLKVQTFSCHLLATSVILGVNLGGILLNIGGSRVYVLSAYIMVRVLTPGGGWGSERTPQGGAWRKFSEDYFFPSRLVRRYLKLSFAKPLPKALVEAESKPDAQFIIAAFPHGCNSDFRIAMDAMLGDAFPNLAKRDKVRALAASVLFWIPIVRELSLWSSCINASRPIAEKALDARKTLLILPGGEAEQIRTTYGKERVYVQKRKGFVKLAIRKGIPIVPMYVFGCSDSYYTYNNDLFPRFRQWLVQSFGICITLCSGLWGNPLCPLPKTTTMVLAAPMAFPQSNEPTSAEIDAAHSLFIEQLKKLFDANKERLGYGDRTLEIL